MSEPSADTSQTREILQLPLIFLKKLRLLLMGMGGWQCHHDKTCQVVAHGDGWMTMSSW